MNRKALYGFLLAANLYCVYLGGTFIAFNVLAALYIGYELYKIW